MVEEQEKELKKLLGSLCPKTGSAELHILTRNIYQAFDRIISWLEEYEDEGYLTISYDVDEPAERGPNGHHALVSAVDITLQNGHEFTLMGGSSEGPEGVMDQILVGSYRLLHATDHGGDPDARQVWFNNGMKLTKKSFVEWLLHYVQKITSEELPPGLSLKRKCAKERYEEAANATLQDIVRWLQPLVKAGKIDSALRWYEPNRVVVKWDDLPQLVFRAANTHHSDLLTQILVNEGSLLTLDEFSGAETIEARFYNGKPFTEDSFLSWLSQYRSNLPKSVSIKGHDSDPPTRYIRCETDEDRQSMIRQLGVADFDNACDLKDLAWAEFVRSAVVPLLDTTDRMRATIRDLNRGLQRFGFKNRILFCATAEQVAAVERLVETVSHAIDRFNTGDMTMRYLEVGYAKVEDELAVLLEEWKS